MERFFYTFGATTLLIIIMFPLAKVVNFLVTAWAMILVWATSGELLFLLPDWVASETNFIVSTALIQLISVYYIVSIPLYVIVYIYHKKSEFLFWKVVFFFPYLTVAAIVLLIGGETDFDTYWGAFCLVLAAFVSYFRFRTSWLPKLSAKTAD